MNESLEWQQRLRQEANQSDRNWWVVMVLSVTFGYTGIDRFYLHDVTLGSLKLFSFGGIGFWWAADLILLFTGHMRDADGRKVLPPWMVAPSAHVKL